MWIGGINYFGNSKFQTMYKLFIISIFALLPITSMAQEIDYLILNNEYDKALQVIESELTKDEVQPKLYEKRADPSKKV